MIHFKNVTKYYKIKSGKHYILQNVNYNFPDKTSIAILGKNGAGKSTLLRMMGGIELANSGEISSDCSISWPVGLASGFQANISAKDNIKFVCRIYNKSISETKNIIDFVEDFAELGNFFTMPIRTYSSGMRSRISFGLSMAFDFDYYLVDEVVGVGDQNFKDKAKNLFDERRKNSSIIMVSHNMAHLKENCDMGIYLSNGEFTVYDNIDDAIKAYQSNKN